MSRPVLILPGWQNSGPEHWQTVWQRAHPEYIRVEQREWEYPVCDEWVATLEAALAAQPEPPVLVAHSLGCVLVAQWASRQAQQGYPPHRVHGALLVAPPDVERRDTTTDISGFVPIPRDPLPFPSILVASTNDPYCSLERAEQFAVAWGSRVVIAGACGHLNTDAGFGPWPAGERLLADLLTQDGLLHRDRHAR